MAKKKKSRRQRKKRRSQQTPPKPTSRETAAEGPSQKKTAPGRKQDKLTPKRFTAARRYGIPAAASVVVLGAVLFLVLRLPKGESVVRDRALNVLLITLDTTRADRIGCYGYASAGTPNLDSLAQQGTRFAEAYCQVPLTLPSHCSILTGTYPLVHKVHNNGSYYLNPEFLTLAEVLKSQGFSTAAFAASFTVDSRFGLDQGFDVYDDDFNQDSPFKSLNSERPAEEVYTSFAGWLDDFEDEQFFCWVHLFDPHLPYRAPSPYAEKYATRPYDGEIAYMDSAIGAILDKLRDRGILEETLIVLAGDHGEGLGDKDEIGHGIFLYDMVMKVPLIFHAPGRLPAGMVIPARVRLIDIFPTILDLLGMERGEEIQGRSLVPYLEGRKKADLDSYIETFYPRENYGWSELTGILKGDWKYIQAPEPELYDLAEDPDEENNLIRSHARVASSLKEDLEELIRDSSTAPGTSSRALSATEQEQLRSLGYIRASGPDPTGDYPDPKHKIAELRLIQQAEMYETEGDFDQAAALHEQILARQPDTPSSYINLALTRARMKDFDEAVRILKQGIDRIPGSVTLLARLGHTYLVMGRLEDAFGLMQQVLEIDTRHFDALTASAVILDSLGKKEAARDFFEKALAIEPENKHLRMNFALNLATGGKIPEAIEAYTGLIRDYPDEYSLYQYRGIALAVSGRYAEAVENLNKAISLNPTPIAYLNLALAYKKTGRIEDAVRCFELYLEDPQGEDPGKVESVRRELARLRRSLKK